MAEAAMVDRAVETEFEAQELYARSLRFIRRLGRMAREGAEQELYDEYDRYLAHTDFVTAIEENLKTDPDFREDLDVTSKHTFPVIDGRVCAANGELMHNVLSRGFTSSRRAALADPRMKTQVVRDEGDLFNLEAVEAMPAGTSRFALSMEPKKELREEPKFWTDLGYRENIAYLQWYCKTTEGTVVGGAYSIDLSDEATWREVFAELGTAVPEDVSPNTWIRHGIERQMTPEDAEQFVLDIRRQYYEKRGVASRRYSVTEFVASNSKFIDHMFDAYYPAIGQAVDSGNKNDIVHNFVASVLPISANLKPEIRRELIRIYNRQAFDDASGRMVEAAVRYAVVEQLRKGLKQFVNPDAESRRDEAEVEHMITVSSGADLMQINQLLARNINAGAEAGRSYGGCSNLDMSRMAEQSSSGGGKDSQDVFGGNANEQGSSSEGGACDYFHSGCYCCPYNDDGRPLGRTLTVKARRDKNGTARCLRRGCGAELSGSGSAFRGEIYEKALRLQALHNRVSEYALAA